MTSRPYAALAGTLRRRLLAEGGRYVNLNSHCIATAHRAAAVGLPCHCLSLVNRRTYGSAEDRSLIRASCQVDVIHRLGYRCRTGSPLGITSTTILAVDYILNTTAECSQMLGFSGPTRLCFTAPSERVRNLITMVSRWISSPADCCRSGHKIDVAPGG